jgi:fructokinase
VIVTDGARPVSCFTSGWAFALDVPHGPVVDTVGAGDAFGGTLLARWVERGFGRAEFGDQSAVRDAVELAIRAASLTCGRAGADPPERGARPASARVSGGSVT